MLTKSIASESIGFDPELPKAIDVLTALCCVATQYGLEPSHDLASLGFRLAKTLNAQEYAESDSMVVLAKQLLAKWQELFYAHQEFEMRNLMSDYVAQSLTHQ